MKSDAHFDDVTRSARAVAERLDPELTHATEVIAHQAAQAAAGIGQAAAPVARRLRGRGGWLWLVVAAGACALAAAVAAALLLRRGT